jgi:hypothetical protein
MRISNAACLLLLLFACGCNGFDVSLLIEPQDLPQGVVESASKHWPGARLHSAVRIYTSDSWGDYRLNFELPGGMMETSTLSKTGVIKWRSHPLSSKDCSGIQSSVVRRAMQCRQDQNERE